MTNTTLIYHLFSIPETKRGNCLFTYKRLVRRRILFFYIDIKENPFLYVLYYNIIYNNIMYNCIYNHIYTIIIRLKEHNL